MFLLGCEGQVVRHKLLTDSGAPFDKAVLGFVLAREELVFRHEFL